MKPKISYRMSIEQAVLLTICYCIIIFLISSQSRPTEELGLPTGVIPHFIEYFGLGTLAWCVAWLKRPRLTLSQRVIYAFCFCSLYAVSDEIHQAFVPLRNCEFYDWLVDSLGSTLGIIAMEKLTANGFIKIRRAF